MAISIDPRITKRIYWSVAERNTGNEVLRTSILAIALFALVSLAPTQAATQTASFNTTISFDGVIVTVSSTFTIDTTLKTLSGTASVSVMDSTTGATIISKAFTISLSFGMTTSNTIRFVLSVPVASLMLGVSCAVSTGSTPVATCIVSRDPDLNHDGIVNITDVALLAYSYGSTTGSAKYNPAADLNANGRVDIGDAAIIAADYKAPILS